MDILVSVKTIFLAMFEMLIFALIGFVITRLKIIKHEGLQTISSLVINITLPLFIFQRLISGFTFQLYSDWWIFPLMSLCITTLGFFIGISSIKIFKVQHKREFLSLAMFQNSGYLPLAIISVLFPIWQAQVLFIYIFLFLLGFDLVMWSFGVQLLSQHIDIKRLFNLKKLLSPPVIANLISLGLILFGISKFIPEVIIRPLQSVGETTIPLAILVLGGNLAEVDIRNSLNRETLLVVGAKLFIMPLLALLFLKIIPLPRLTGLLLVLQCALPSATSLAVISRKHGLEEKLISHTILVTHLVSLVTLPLFLLLFGLL